MFPTTGLPRSNGYLSTFRPSPRRFNPGHRLRKLPEVTVSGYPPDLRHLPTRVPPMGGTSVGSRTDFEAHPWHGFPQANNKQFSGSTQQVRRQRPPFPISDYPWRVPGLPQSSDQTEYCREATPRFYLRFSLSLMTTRPLHNNWFCNFIKASFPATSAALFRRSPPRCKYFLSYSKPLCLLLFWSRPLFLSKAHLRFHVILLFLSLRSLLSVRVIFPIATVWPQRLGVVNTL